MFVYGYGVVMNSAHKRFLKIIWKDIVYNLECIIFCSIWIWILILIILIQLNILPFKAIFWYLGTLVCIGLVNVIYLITKDIVIYLKNCWNNSKDYES